jgi:hypothetical protein
MSVSISDYPYYPSSPNVIGTLGLFNVKDFGAVGDSVTDDSAAILAAFAAAAANKGGTVYFPPSGDNSVNPGGYYYNSATPIVPALDVGILTFYPANILAGPLATTCFHFSFNGTYVGPASLPGIFNFPQYGIWFDAVNTDAMEISCPWIKGCGTGVRFDASNGTCNSAIVKGVLIENCGIGVDWVSTSAVNQMQGCQIYQGYVYGSTTANLHHNYPGGGGIILNGVFDTGVDGGGVTPYGMYLTSGTYVQYFTVRSNYFNNHTTAAIYCAGSSSIIWSDLELGLCSTPQTYASFTWGTGGQQIDGPNRISALNTTSPANAYVAASLTPNARSTFASGTAYPFNQLPISFAIPSGAVGDLATFFVYHPWACGGVTNTNLQMTFSSDIAWTTSSATLPAVTGSVTLNVASSFPSGTVTIIGNAGATSAQATITSRTGNSITVTINSYTRGAAGALAAGASVFIAAGATQNWFPAAVYDNSAVVPNEIVIVFQNTSATTTIPGYLYGILTFGK